MRWSLLLPGGEDFAKHIKFLLTRERGYLNSRGVELVVGDVDQPGAEETSPANCQHDDDLKLAQIVFFALDLLDSHLFSDIHNSEDGQTEKILMIFIGIFIISFSTSEAGGRISGNI